MSGERSLAKRLAELKTAVDQGLLPADVAEELRNIEIARWTARGDGGAGTCWARYCSLICTVYWTRGHCYQYVCAVCQVQTQTIIQSNVARYQSIVQQTDGSELHRPGCSQGASDSTVGS